MICLYMSSYENGTTLRKKIKRKVSTHALHHVEISTARWMYRIGRVKEEKVSLSSQIEVKLPISCSIDTIVKPNTSIQVEVLGTAILEGFNQMEQPKATCWRYAKGRCRISCHGPVIANVIPGLWMFTKSVVPSGEKVAPASSDILPAFRANL